MIGWGKRIAAAATALILAAIPFMWMANAEEAQLTLAQRQQKRYEESVQERYREFYVEGYHSFLLADKLFASAQIHADIQENNVGSEVVRWASHFMGEGLDSEHWTSYLATQLMMQEAGFEEASEALAEYDALKSLEEYAAGAIDIVTDTLDIDAGKMTESALDVLSTLMGTTSDLIGGTVDTLEDYQNILKTARSYENHSLVLKAIIANTEDTELKKAAEFMMGAADKSLEMQSQSLFGLALTGDAAVASNIIAPELFDYLKSLPEYADDPHLKKLVDGEEKFLEGFNLFNTFYDLGIFGGDMILGTTDTYKRYSEIAAINELIAVLKKAVQDGWVDAYAGAEEIAAWADNYVPLMQTIVLLRLRGEYCAMTMVYDNTQGLSILQRMFGPYEQAIDFYNDRKAYLEECWALLNAMLTAPQAEAFCFEFRGEDVIRYDFDNDGAEDVLGVTQGKTSVSVNVATTANGQFSFEAATMVPIGYILGADMGDGTVTMVIMLATGMVGGGGSVHIGVYRSEDEEYVLIEDVLESQEFTGTVNKDGATAKITTASGETFKGRMSIGWDQLAGSKIMTDPIYYVEFVYNEEEGCYDLVTRQVLWPDEMHSAGAGIGCAQYHLENGEFIMSRQWVEFYEE